MAIHASLLLAISSVGLLAGLVVLVLGKRLIRGRAERRSRRRRVDWISALGTGSVADMRMRELRALAREAARRSAAQSDLLVLLGARRLPPSDDRRVPFQQAMRRAGLVRALRSACDSRSAVARGRAALLWARLGLPGAERAVAPLLTDPDPDVRAAATQALACCASAEAAWALLRAVRDGDADPERVVERLTGPWAAEPLLSAMREPSFAAIQPWLAEGLGLTRDPRAEGPLTELMARGDEEQRIRACRALGRLGLRTCSHVLVSALADPSQSVRAQAARALAELRDAGSVTSLLHLLGDESWWVRARAAEALRALGPQGYAALRWCADSHPDPFARERAAEALALEAAHREGAAVA
jgi:HEAT repeat protein